MGQRSELSNFYFDLKEVTCLGLNQKSLEKIEKESESEEKQSGVSELSLFIPTLPDFTFSSESIEGSLCFGMPRV